MPRKGTRPLGYKVRGTEDRHELVIAYWRQGHSIRETARVFRMSVAGIHKIVKGQEREGGDEHANV